MGRTIRYIGFTKDLTHPADRRRVGILRKTKDVKIVGKDSHEYDLSLISINAGIHEYLKEKNQKPVIIDIVDAYLANKSLSLIDVLRNVLRSSLGKSKFSAITYKNYLIQCIQKADGCTVPSEEIANLVRRYNPRVYIIPDCHEEIKVIKYSAKNRGILWEGFGSNLKHLISVASQLDDFLVNYQARLIIVTEPHFYRWGNTILKTSTKSIIAKHFPKSFASNVEIVEWSLENLFLAAEQCRVALIPIQESDRFAQHKSENKLLGMWTLGLPTVVSSTPSYRRTMKVAGQLDNVFRGDSIILGLSTIYEDKERLNEMHHSGVKFVKTRYGLEQCIKLWMQVINDY